MWKNITRNLGTSPDSSGIHVFSVEFGWSCFLHNTIKGKLCLLLNQKMLTHLEPKQKWCCIQETHSPLLESEIFVSGEKAVSGCCCLGEGQFRPAKEPTFWVAQEFQWWVWDKAMLILWLVTEPTWCMKLLKMKKIKWKRQGHLRAYELSAPVIIK